LTGGVQLLHSLLVSLRHLLNVALRGVHLSRVYRIFFIDEADTTADDAHGVGAAVLVGAGSGVGRGKEEE
jgi:hypothetical protein